MALVFGDKGRYRSLKRELAEAGFPYRVRGGLPVYDVANEATMQAIIDAFDEVQAERDIKIADIKTEGLSRIQALFPAIKDLDDLDIEAERWLSIVPAARQPTVKYGTMIAIYLAAKQGIADVNSAQTVQAVQAVGVIWP